MEEGGKGRPTIGHQPLQKCCNQKVFVKNVITILKYPVVRRWRDCLQVSIILRPRLSTYSKDASGQQLNIARFEIMKIVSGHPIDP